MSIFESVVLWSTSAMFVITAAMNLAGPAFVREEFENWGYPNWFRYVVGLCELAAAASLLIPSLRVYGALLALAILVGVFFSLTKTREWPRMLLPGFLAAVIVGFLIQNGSALPLLP